MAESHVVRLFDFIGVEFNYKPNGHEFYINRSHHSLTLKLDRIVNLLFFNNRSSPLLGECWYRMSIPRKGTTIPLFTCYRRLLVEKYLDPYIMYKYFSSNALLSKKNRAVYAPLYYKSNYEISKIIGTDMLKKYGYPMDNKKSKL